MCPKFLGMFFTVTMIRIWINQIHNFNNVFEGKHKDYKHLDSDSLDIIINTIGKVKDAVELLQDSVILNKSSLFGFQKPLAIKVFPGCI